MTLFIKKGTVCAFSNKGKKMTTIDKQTIKEMAFWVRVRITDDEAERMAKEFTQTLNWIGEELKNPELQKVKAMVTPFDEPICLRDDVVHAGGQVAAVLKNAPDATDEFFSVPKMVE